ncbi:hypothetical protein GCM10010381_41090 [Streptomyces xantholiticus]|nr:hypothetical protein GCM10010381_41090 [Streptomyces xantholiticus]
MPEPVHSAHPPVLPTLVLQDRACGAAVAVGMVSPKRAVAPITAAAIPRLFIFSSPVRTAERGTHAACTKHIR